MLARLMAFLVWGLLACSGAYWALHVFATPLAAPANARPAAEQGGGAADLNRLFGAPAPVTAEPVAAMDSRFKLIGVVAPKRPGGSQASEGVALIAVDGVPRTVRVGAVVEGQLQLMAVDARSASLGQGGVVSLSLQLAPPTAAATGALPPAAPSPTILGGNSAQGMPVMPGTQSMSQPTPLQDLRQQQPPPEARGNLPTR